jgi:hypothetical protein
MILASTTQNTIRQPVKYPLLSSPFNKTLTNLHALSIIPAHGYKHLDTLPPFSKSNNNKNGVYDIACARNKPKTANVNNTLKEEEEEEEEGRADLGFCLVLFCTRLELIVT